MRRAELARKMRAVREEFESLLATLTPEQMTTAGAAGEWSVKDMLAHIAWYEAEEAEFYAESGGPASPWWDTPQDPRNALIFEQNRDRPVDDVLADFRRAHERFVAVVEGMSEEDLATPGRFEGTDEDRPPWRKIAVHSCDHDREHIDMIRAWLGSGDPTS